MSERYVAVLSFGVRPSTVKDANGEIVFRHASYDKCVKEAARLNAANNNTKESN